MKFIRSFGYAWQGVQYCFRSQFNFRFQLGLLSLAVIAGFLLAINTTEWILLIICSMAVLAMELLNTAIEHACDTFTRDFHPAIKIIKDASAAAVLVCASGSAITGGIIFLPKIIRLFNQLS